MEEKRNVYKIYEGDEIGEVQITEDVIAIIAAVAAMDVEGVASMAGNITTEIVSKLGMKKLSKGVSVSINDEGVNINLSINLYYGYNIMEVSSKIQEKVKTSMENMTGLKVGNINVGIASVAVQ